MAGRQYRNNFGRNEKYYKHDDRGERPSWNYNKGRGANSRGKRPYRAGYNGRMPRDELMNDNNRQQHRQVFYDLLRGRGRGKRNFRPPFVHSKSNSDWSEIVIKNIIGADGDEVIATIKKFVDDDFSPIMPMFRDTTTFSFYLEDNRSATSAMLNLSNRITLDNGQKLKINASDNSPIFTKPNEANTEIIKKVMSDRYNAEMHRLDLKQFHKDPNLIHSKVFFPLYLYEALSTIVNVIVTNIPDIQEIDLSHNKIYNLGPLEALNQTSLKRINLEHNRISRIHFLCRLKNLELIDISLRGNPLCKMSKTPDLYLSNVRKLFPKLQYLDGNEVPKVIGFEVSDAQKFPKSLPSQYGNDEIKRIIEQFILDYYKFYEGSNRRVLEAAYTEDACYTMINVASDNMASSKYMNKILPHNRNLLKLLNPMKRFHAVIQGKQNIVNRLCEMPKAHHDPTSFLIDVPFAQPELLHVCLRGVFTLFLEGGQPILRTFSRSMVIIPVGTGFCISNEQYFVGIPSADQKSAQNKKVNQSLNTSSIATVSSSPVSSGSQNPIFSDLDPEQMEKIRKFTEISKMKPQYSKECLQKNGWVFEKAGEDFLSSYNKNMIPADYFET